MLFTAFILSSCLVFSRVQAQRNITVNETDSAITYVEAGDAAICQYDTNGTLLGGQPGCYNVLPSNCTEHAAMSQNASASATFKFTGSAIYINSLQYIYSPLYTITLDGESSDVDAWVDERFFTCAQPLFSKGGLDPRVEHEIVLATKGVSPQSTGNRTDDDAALVTFSLISFVYTQENSTGSSDNGSVKYTLWPLFMWLLLCITVYSVVIL